MADSINVVHVKDVSVVSNLDVTPVVVVQAGSVISSNTPHSHDSRYYTNAQVDEKITTISLTPGPQGPQGETGPQGPAGPSNLLVLGATDPVPVDTPAGTVIVRTA